MFEWKRINWKKSICYHCPILWKQLFLKEIVIRIWYAATVIESANLDILRISIFWLVNVSLPLLIFVRTNTSSIYNHVKSKRHLFACNFLLCRCKMKRIDTNGFLFNETHLNRLNFYASLLLFFVICRLIRRRSLNVVEIVR